MEPNFDEHEAEHLYEYMQSGGWVTEFRKTAEFADMIAQYTGSKYCSITANGTVSLLILGELNEKLPISPNVPRCRPLQKEPKDCAASSISHCVIGMRCFTG